MILGIIPSRYASTRFPGKPLAVISGVSMIERVYRQSEKAVKLDRLIVATDDERIADHVKKFGGEVVMTSPDHPSGTDRCYEALIKTNGKFTHVINIQGDEPFIDPGQINLLAEMLQDDSTEIATLISPVKSDIVLENPAIPKVVVNQKKEALYFSRQSIPYLREINTGEWLNHHPYYKHVGMYGYRSDILGMITKLAPSPLELAEKLEQLRWLENGFTIRCGITEAESYAVDHPEDIPRILKEKGMSEG